MKTVTLSIGLILLLSGLATVAVAADLSGQQQYKIVSYSLSSDGTNNSPDSLHSGSLLITGFTSDFLSDSTNSSSVLGINGPKQITDVFAVSADFLATPDLSLHGAIGVSKNRWEAPLQSDYNSSWEANLGVIYKLFNNIRYEVHFGYMEAGNLFKESPVYSDVESIIMISNKLTMSF